MTNFKLVIAAAGAMIATGLTGPASADPLSPWEKFCLTTSAPGKDLGNCLDGLPSRGGRNNILVAPVDGQRPGVEVKQGSDRQKLVAPRKLRRR